MKTNWQTEKIGEVCDIFSGNSINAKIKKEKYFGLTKGYPYIATKDVKFNNSIDYENGVKIPNNESKFRTSKKDSVLICAEGGSAGRKIGFTKMDVCFGNKLFSIHSNNLNNKYIYYFCFADYFQGEFKKRLTGIIGGVSLKKVKDIKISFPSLSEQKRIVEILDDTFEKISKAKENTEKNLQNTKELFESYIQNFFANSEKDWEEKILEEIADVEYGYTNKAKVIGDYRYVRITDTDKNGLLTFDNKLYIKSFKEKDKYILRQGDLLMARVGASFGNVLFFEYDEPSIFASYLIRIKFKKEIENKLYWYFTKSRLYWEQVQKLSSGSAQPQFNGAALKKIIYTYPKSILKQKSIIKRLDTLSEQTKKLEAINKQKLADLEELKKSILNKAFRGKL